ncbi:MAG: DUF4258 domain-containing protein [Deltaproteobacteria bacterium]|nr:DUF4258 domain-containing protein [Deltaproteobacteria bacterium]
MDRVKARENIRHAVKWGCVHISAHCRQRMVQRCVSIDDISHVLSWGTLQSLEPGPEPDSWKCQVQGGDLDGDELVVHVLIKPQQDLILITVY